MNSNAFGSVAVASGWFVVVVGFALYDHGPIKRNVGMFAVASGIAMILGGFTLIFL